MSVSTQEHLLDKNYIYRELISGGLAGSIGIFIGFPFDMIKVKLQARPDLYKSAISCLKVAWKEEGIRGLYRGCLAPIAFQGPINSLLFVGDSTALKYLEPDLRYGQVGKPKNIFLAGCCGGFLQCILLVPSEVIKCTMQLRTINPNRRVINLSHLEQTVQCASDIYRAEGIAGFYKGFNVTAMREVPSIGIYFFSYKFIKDSLKNKFQRSGEQVYETASTLFAGGAAGAMSWTVIYPFDVIKSNIQASDPTSSGNKDRLKRSTWSVARELYGQQGARIFVAGLGTAV